MNLMLTSENYVAKSICPGLTLHLFVAENSFKEKSFFENNTIMESIVKYKVVFSYAKGQTEMDIGYLDNHSKALSKYQERIKYLMTPFFESNLLMFFFKLIITNDYTINKKLFINVVVHCQGNIDKNKMNFVLGMV